MTKLWITVAVGWLAGTALAVAQAPADSSRPAPPVPTVPVPPTPSGQPSPFVFPGLGQPNLPPIPGQPPGPPAAPPPPGNPPPAGPGQPPRFVPAVPFLAPPPPPPSSSPIVTGIIAPPERGPQAWLEGGFVSWWIGRGIPTPPMATTGSLSDVMPGALNAPGTHILFGGNDVNFGAFTGGYLRGGLWLDYQQDWALEGYGFWMTRNASHFSTASDANGNPVLSVPFFNVLTNSEFVAAVAIPTAQYGNITADTTSQFGGGELNLMHPLMMGDGFQLLGLVGGRYFGLSEGLTFSTTTGITPALSGIAPLFFGGAPIANFPNVVITQDVFKTRNQFYGGQVGLRARWDFLERFSLSSQATLAVGNIQQHVQINGSTTLLASVAGGILGTAPGGLFAQPSNSGAFDRDRFGVMPGGQVQLGYDVLPGLTLEFGWTILYLNNTIRPGNVIDRDLNPMQAPGLTTFAPVTGPVFPRPVFGSTSFLAQGINVGVRVSY